MGGVRSRARGVAGRPRLSRRYTILTSPASVFNECLCAPRKLSSRGKAQRRARFARESRFDRSDVPIDKLDDAALVNRRVRAGLIGGRTDPARILLDDPAVLVVGFFPT